ncbi:MAG: citrate lyase holo-[Mogibacterium sp.]|nr:citrate lyase holo-[acyl-carrier protein] synthase [Mogibacterium sp.]
MRSYRVDLEQMLSARDRRVGIQNRMLSGAAPDQCLVCLTMNIAGEIKRTPISRMLFGRGVRDLYSLGLEIRDDLILDEVTGTEGFWLINANGAHVKHLLEGIEDSFPAARLFDFDVLIPGGAKLSRAVSRRCLICDAPAAECARSRKHSLDVVKAATDRLLREFCADELAQAAYDSLLDELYTTPKPGLVDRMSNGAHTDMDVPLFEKSAASLRQYFRDAVLLGLDDCSMGELRRRGLAAEATMFAATGGVNTHKGMIYSMGLLLAGMGKVLTQGGSCLYHAAELARQDADERLRRSLESPSTNGGNVYRRYGASGAMGEAVSGFPNAVQCARHLRHYREQGCEQAAALAFCDTMAQMEDTNLLHRGGQEGLDYARQAAADISKMPAEFRVPALAALDSKMISRNLSPGGSADMLALAFLLERWRELSAGLILDEGGELS